MKFRMAEHGCGTAQAKMIRSLSTTRLAAILVFMAGVVMAETGGRYKVCYGEMAVSLLLEVSDGATREASESFVAGWMEENAELLDAGFSRVVSAMLSDLNIDRQRHDPAYSSGLRQWRDCLVRVYDSE